MIKGLFDRGSWYAPFRARIRSRVAFLTAASAAAMLLAACGGSSHGHGHGVTAKVTRVHGVASPKGAAKAKKGDLGQLARVSLGISPQIKGIDNVAITQAIPALSSDLNQFWSQEFANSGVQWPSVQQAFVETQPVTSTCNTTIAPTDPMHLCFGTGAGATYTFYWTVPYMQQNIDTDPGGANLAVGMAGMYSNAVLDLFGFYQQLQSGQITASQWEQQNFCLTGIYARSLDQRGFLEAADIQTIATWLHNLAASSASSGNASGQQLTSAFVIGFKSGSPATCGVPPGGGGTTTTTTSTGT